MKYLRDDFSFFFIPFPKRYICINKERVDDIRRIKEKKWYNNGKIEELVTVFLAKVNISCDTKLSKIKTCIWYYYLVLVYA